MNIHFSNSNMGMCEDSEEGNDALWQAGAGWYIGKGI